MAPQWFALRVKHSTLHASSPTQSCPKYTAEDDDVRSEQKDWNSTSRGIRKSPTTDADSASSTSLSCEAAQYARRQAAAPAPPIGFEQFSPPFYQRRGFSEEADDALKVGTTLHLHHGGGRRTQRRRRSSSSEESQTTATCDEKTHDEIDEGGEETDKGRQRRKFVSEDKTMKRILHQSSDQDSICTGSHQSDSMHVLSRLPPGGREAVVYDQRKTIRTMVTILGGWCALIAFCFGFKILSIKYQVRAPDILAEWVLSDPTATTQWFTFTGVLLGEIALILWGHSISYMAFRRLAYGKERTELLTYAAWNEMSRAGYTLSRRRPLWPAFTLLIFIGNTFLPAGFSTLLTPKPMLVSTPYDGVEIDELSTGFGAAIGFLPASTFPNPANLSCGSQYVSNFWTFASHPGTIFDPCPSLDDVQTLIMAGRAKLEDSVNQPEPLFKLPSSITYVGGTGGISTLGVDGILPFSTWTRPPKRAPTPRGYNYTYTLDQQGLTVDVKCWQPKMEEERNILTIKMTDTAHLLQVTLKCNVGGTGQDVSYHYIGSSSIILMGCTSKSAAGKDDPDSTMMYFKDAGAEIYGSESELGGDLVCDLSPKWTRNQVAYVSDRRWIKVTTQPDNGPPNRLTGFHGELGPGNHSFQPTSEQSKKDFFQYYTRLLTVQGPLAAVGNAFVYTGTLSSLINATVSNDTLLASSTVSPTVTNLTNSDQLVNTVLFGKNSAVQSLAAFNARVNAGKVKTWIQPSQVEVFIKGVFEYAATSQREWFQHYAVDGGNFNGPIGLQNGTIPVNGVWVSQTVGYGSSTENNDHYVYFSLLPLLAFALISWGMIAWSHWYDSPRDSAYAADIDPTDWLEAVVAASQGGLRFAFEKDALQNSSGLQNARKVRVRLGQIIDRDDPDSTPRLGFVCVD